MQMATISRWTLAYFGCALTALVLALALMIMGLGYPNAAFADPETLIIVHLAAIGWLSLLMLGALLQFLPVLVGRELALPRLAPYALVTILAGLVMLLLGFAGLAGWSSTTADILPLAGLFIVAGFALAAIMLFATLLQAKTLPLPAGFVAVALMCALVATLLGDTLAAALSGMVGGDFALSLVSHGVPLHAGFGLGGWLTLAAMGVSYRLLSMFLLAPERAGRGPKVAFLAAVAALAMLCGALCILVVLNMPWPVGLTLGGLATIVSVLFYLGDVFTLYRTRRRPKLELHMAAATAAFVLLGSGSALVVWSTATGSAGGIAAAVYALSLGWLGGLGLSMLYKIIPFLTWLECFAPSMGRIQTPRVQDLVREDQARPWFAAYFVAVVLSIFALLAGLPDLLRGATGLQLVAVLGLILQFYRARRLMDLPAQWRSQPRPRLLLPTPRPRSLT